MITATTARVVESWQGRPLRTVHAYGKGTAHAFAWSAFAAYDRASGNANLRGLLRDILAEAGVKPYVALPELDALAAGAVYTSQLVRADGARVLTFVNPGWTERAVHAVVPQARRAEKMFGAPEVKAEAQTPDLDLKFTLAPWQSVMMEIQ